MKNDKSLITYIDYGCIKCNVNELMKQSNLTKTQIARRTGIHHQTIQRYMDNTAIDMIKKYWQNYVMYLIAI